MQALHLFYSFKEDIMEIAGKITTLLKEEDHGDFFKGYVREVSRILCTPLHKILFTTSDDDFGFCEKAYEYAVKNHTGKFETGHGNGYVCLLDGGRKFLAEYENGLIVITFHEDYLFFIDSKFN